LIGLKVFSILLLMLCGATYGGAQNVPVLSGGTGFFDEDNGGVNSFQLVLAPVLVVPLGEKWLIESRADLREVYSRENGSSGSYQGQFFGTLEYLQIDYNATSRLTITSGRFLSSFGIFSERLSPIWINKFQGGPIVAAIGTGTGYNDGFMVRGALISNQNYALNYAAYFSTLSTVENLRSERGAGGRLGIFIPRTRLEVGASYRRTLQGIPFNSQGVDVSWSPYNVPVQFFGEWAHSPSGQGYWIQASYRLAQLTGSDSGIGRLEPVFRMQQFFRSQFVLGDSLPPGNTTLPEFGLNYYFPHEVRLNAAYGRQYMSHSTDTNVWNFGITYRFLFPLWPGASK